jgi:diguanylate cyclase (GGDEF)-like protein/PAS domain S-box-containing protein
MADPRAPRQRLVENAADVDEERLQDLVENASDLVQSVAMDGRFLYVNRRWRELLGYAPDEISRLRLMDVIRPDHREACGRMFETLCGGQELPTVETAFLTRDGGSLELEGRVTLRRDAAGRPTATRGIFRDVTEQRAARRRIDELLAMTRAIVDHAPAGIALYEAHGRCVEANDALARMVGAAAEQVRRQNFRQLESWRRHGLLERAEACLAQGVPTDLETWIATSFGTRACLHCWFVPVELSTGRHLLLLVADMTTERRREETLVARQRRLIELHEIARDIAEQTHLDHVLQTAIDRARELVQADVGAIVRMDPATGRPREAHPSNYPMDRIPPGTEVEGRGLLGHIAGGTTVHSPRVDGEPSFVGWPEWHPRVGPMLGIPVRDRDRVVAMLLLGRLPGAAPFDDDDRTLVETIASLAAVAMRVAQQLAELQTLNARLNELATTDALMQIGNRRAFDDALALQHATAVRYGVPYGLLLADIDHFKLYNDRYGHPAGDRVLATVAGLLKRTIRAMDGLFRYGGEELVLLLPHQHREGTTAAAERLRRCVEQAAVEHADNGPGVVTVSFGAAVFDPADPDGRERGAPAILDAADQALYRAKQLGRNRVEAAPATPAGARGAPRRGPAAG